MNAERKFPENPLEFIRRCVQSRKLLWTYHVNMRLRGRFISEKAIIESTVYYEIIEEYPMDKYLPSFLLYSQHGGDIFHVLFAVDVEGDNIRVITAYRPSLEEWEADFKSRRQRA